MKKIEFEVLERLGFRKYWDEDDQCEYIEWHSENYKFRVWYEQNDILVDSLLDESIDFFKVEIKTILQLEELIKLLSQ